MSETLTIDQLIVFRPKPGDVMIYTVPGSLTLDQTQALRHIHEDAYPGARCLILLDGIKASMLNRWVPFTEEELETLSIHLTPTHGDPDAIDAIIWDEACSELARRKTGAT